MLCHSTCNPWVNLNTRVTLNFPQVSHNVHTYGTNSLAPVSLTTNKKIISQANLYQVPHRQQRLLGLYITDDTTYRKHLLLFQEASSQSISFQAAMLRFPTQSSSKSDTKPKTKPLGASLYRLGLRYILYIFKA